METEALSSPRNDSKEQPHLSWLLTPPKPADPSSSKTPRDYLQDPNLLPNHKRKSSIKLTEPLAKSLRFDPEPLPTDQTIFQYHERLARSDFATSRHKLCVEMPFLDVVEFANFENAWKHSREHPRNARKHLRKVLRVSTIGSRKPWQNFKEPRQNSKEPWQRSKEPRQKPKNAPRNHGRSPRTHRGTREIYTNSRENHRKHRGKHRKTFR
ncbi:MAG: hypothetical protein Q9221_007232 [Calogaya cf. arnoldii]